MEAVAAAQRGEANSAWPRYDEAVVGFRNYWFPVLFSRELGKRPVGLTLLGESVVLIRDRGRARALHDRCPHRGIPLSAGKQYAPGTLTCPYHGWTYDLETGSLVAVLTDRPDSPICGKVQVHAYPVEERIGIVWVYVGELPAPPVEADIPAELFDPDLVILGEARVERGNWRYATENAIDEGHVRFLHRTGLFQIFREAPAWTEFHEDVVQGAETWVVRSRDRMVWQDSYPRVGRWPPKHFWQRRGGPVQISARLPCLVRNLQPTGQNLFNWWVPVAENHYLRFITFALRGTGLRRWWHRAWFHLYGWWARLRLFRSQDQWMIALMETPPERLYGPDKSITVWRKYCQEYARSSPPSASAEPPPSREE